MPSPFRRRQGSPSIDRQAAAAVVGDPNPIAPIENPDQQWPLPGAEADAGGIQRPQIEIGVTTRVSISAWSLWESPSRWDTGTLHLARALAVPLLSADSKIQADPHVSWVW